MTSTPAIQLTDVSKTYLSKKNVYTAVASITFDVLPGEFVTLVGPSGCGKSTLLSMIAGLLPSSSGTVKVKGESIQKPSPRIGYMLQRDCLLPWRTVDENILLGLEIRRENKPQAVHRARELLNELGLDGTQKQYPSQLSGGMRQRVALVRTLALQPEILLLDEPFSSVDFQTKLHLEELLVSVLRRQNKTAILVTHDLEEALAVSDRILIMGGKPSTVKRSLELPDDLRTASPLAARGHPRFRTLFNTLWREMQS